MPGIQQPTASSNSSTAQGKDRAAIIAAAVTVGTVFVVSLLVLSVFYWRYRLRRPHGNLADARDEAGPALQSGSDTFGVCMGSCK